VTLPAMMYCGGIPVVCVRTTVIAASNGAITEFCGVIVTASFVPSEITCLVVNIMPYSTEIAADSLLNFIRIDFPKLQNMLGIHADKITFFFVINGHFEIPWLRIFTVLVSRCMGCVQDSGAF